MNKILYGSHNWLALNINNDAFNAITPFIKGRVIDLGCGAGQYKEDILKLANQYTGVDWQNSFHAESNVDVFADLTRTLPFEDGCADTIVSFQVLEHLPEPDFFLSECFRLLTSNGHILMTVPFMWHIHEAPHDYCRYTRHGIEYLLATRGFTDISIMENTGFWQMWVLKFNYHTLRFARGPVKLFWIPVWWIGQVISRLLDKLEKNPQETASYTVSARKP